MKKLENKLFVLWVLLLALSLFLYMCDKSHADICMDKDNASKLIVEIEQCRINNDICSIKDEQLLVLEAQKDELKKIIALKDEQLAVKDGAITSLNGLVEKEKDDCNVMLKEAKPSLFKQILSGLGFVGAGILIGVLAL